MTKKITPPALARRYGISAEKVLTFIRSGELRAINIATKLGGRPRYLIDETDIADFENRRAAVQVETNKRTWKRGASDESVIRFY